MNRTLVATASSMMLVGSVVGLNAAEGRHMYSAGHVANIDYMAGSFALDNGFVFIAEEPTDLRSIGIGEGVLVRYVEQAPSNVADDVTAATLGLVDPQVGD